MSRLIGYFLSRTFVLVTLFSALNSCQKAEEEVISPGIEIKQFEPSGVKEATLVININNSTASQCEYGFFITEIDSANILEYYEATLTALDNLNTVDLYFSDANLLKNRTRIKIVGNVSAGEILKNQEVVADSLNPNSAYVVRAFLRSANTLSYSRAIGIKSFESNHLEYVTTLSLPFNPVNFHFIGSTAYMLGDTQTFSGSLFSYSLGSASYQAMAACPINNQFRPFSFLSVLDENNQIHYLSQKDGLSGLKPFHRATYDPVTNTWTSASGSTCNTDTNSYRVHYSYYLRGKVISALMWSGGNKLTECDITNFCPPSNANIAAQNCFNYSLYATNVKNSFLFDDTLMYSLSGTEDRIYQWSRPSLGASPICDDFVQDQVLMNPNFIFSHQNYFYTIETSKNPVNNNNNLFLSTFYADNSIRRLFNLSNTPELLPYLNLLQNGVCRAFKEQGGYTWIFVSEKSNPGKVFIFKFKK